MSARVRISEREGGSSPVFFLREDENGKLISVSHFSPRLSSDLNISKKELLSLIALYTIIEKA